MTKQIFISFLFFVFFAPNIFGQDRLQVAFSVAGGFHAKPVEVKLTAALGSKIYYTLDGNRPSNTSPLYTAPIRINRTTVLRAIVFNGSERGRIFTQTYLINEKTNFPVISIATAPEVLFDRTTGWFNPGPNAEKEYPFLKANFWSRDEVGANVEIFETDGKAVFNSRVGMRLFGGMSRVLPQKSLAIACRVAYGESRIKHQIFPNKKQKSFKHLVLRNAGSDWGKAHCRDAVITGLLNEVDISKQAYRPALVFINGNYWGIYNIREKINKHYLEYEFGVDKNKIDLIEHERSIKAGGVLHYQKLQEFMAANDLSLSENYNYVKTQMDVNNFMTYQIVQIFADNQDGGGNIKFWRPQTEDGRWRWILYDTDWGFGLQDETAFKNNSLAFFTEANGPNWPNPPWSTFMLRRLLTNEDFKQQFILKFSDYLNTIFAANNVIQHINRTESTLQPEMKRHTERWQLDINNWTRHLDRMRTFAEQRPDYMRNFIAEMFKVGDLVSVQVQTEGEGYLNFNGNINFKKPIFLGQYFNALPITIRAVPKRGFVFSHWEGLDAYITDPVLNLKLEKNAYSLKAVFKVTTTDLYSKIVINEIAANNALTGDWVELYNLTDKTVDITGWTLRDSKQDFILPMGTIPPKSYAVICQSASAFRKAFPNVENAIGDFVFGLNKTQEKIELYDTENTLIDSTTYALTKMSSAFTFSLKIPQSDNSLLTNWDVMLGNGTPGEDNPSFVEFQAVEASSQQALLTYGGLLLLVLGSVTVFFFYKKRK